MITSEWNGARENVCERVTICFNFSSDWIEKWREFLRQSCCVVDAKPIAYSHDPITWYGINYAETQITQWDFQILGTRTSLARLSFVLKIPLRNLRPSIIHSLPFTRVVQRVYWVSTLKWKLLYAISLDFITIASFSKVLSFLSRLHFHARDIRCRFIRYLLV